PLPPLRPLGVDPTPAPVPPAGTDPVPPSGNERSGPLAIAPTPAPRPAAPPVDTAPAPAAEDVAVATPPPVSSSGFAWPVVGPVIAGCGPTADNQMSSGINIAAAAGPSVGAAAPGTVVYSGNEVRGYGNLVLIRHADG